MSQFAEMIRVEFEYTGWINKRDITPISTSFDLAQINFETAFIHAKQYGKSFGYQVFDLDKSNVVKELELKGGGSLLFGFFEFVRLYSYYGVTNNQNIREQDKRVQTLACAAYSSSFSGPRIAKLQTYISELLVLDLDFQKFCKENNLSFLNIDGSKGPQTKDYINAVNTHYGTNTIPSDIMDQDTAQGGELRDIDNIWNDFMVNEFATPDNRTKIITNLIPKRYSTAIETFVVVRNLLLGNQTALQKLSESFSSYVDDRDITFFIELSNPQKCQEMYGVSHDKLWGELLPRFKHRINTDNNYRGYVPTYFRDRIARDDINIVKRVTIYHRFVI